MGESLSIGDHLITLDVCQKLLEEADAGARNDGYESGTSWYNSNLTDEDEDEDDPPPTPAVQLYLYRLRAVNYLEKKLRLLFSLQN